MVLLSVILIVSSRVNETCEYNSLREEAFIMQTTYDSRPQNIIPLNGRKILNKSGIL